MRIFLAGGTGVIGRRLVPALVERGHDVVATSRGDDGAALVSDLGGTGVVLDAFDRQAVRAAVAAAEPDVVVHQLTAIATVDPKRFDTSMAATNELRTTALDHLVAAAVNARATRFVAQSFTGWTNPSGCRTDCDEDEPLDATPHRSSSASLAAISHLERAVAGSSRLAGVVTRYGHLYGPGTAYGVGGATFRVVTERRFPVVGGGAGVWSFVHVDDAVAATVAAIESAPSGCFNVVDGDPAPVNRWLPAYAAAIGAPPPKSAPALLARAAIGGNGVRMMTATSGSSNARARRVLGWEPVHRSWATGFATCAAAPTP